jgi:hypothetical protein
MNKDIEFPRVKEVSVAIVPENNDEKTLWNVYLLNTGDEPITNVMVTSAGFGKQDEAEQKTSTLRYHFDKVEATGSIAVELIDPAVFHLNNEYWVSFWIGTQLYDKRYLFVPDSIDEQHFTIVPVINAKGIWHE